MKPEQLKSSAKGRPSRSALNSHVACFLQPSWRTKRLIYRRQQAIVAATTPHLYRTSHACVRMCAASHETYVRVQLEAGAGKRRCPRGSRHSGGFIPPPLRLPSRRVPGSHGHVGGLAGENLNNTRACRWVRRRNAVLKKQLARNSICSRPATSCTRAPLRPRSSGAMA